MIYIVDQFVCIKIKCTLQSYYNLLLTDGTSYIFLFHSRLDRYSSSKKLYIFGQQTQTKRMTTRLTNHKLQSLPGCFFIFYLYNVYDYNIEIKQRAQSSPESRQGNNNDNNILQPTQTQSTCEMISATFYITLLFGIAILISCNYVSINHYYQSLSNESEKIFLRS